jgi:iron complex outermembrane receptor protein
MNMKKLAIILLLLPLSISIFAQEKTSTKTTDSLTNSVRSKEQRLMPPIEIRAVRAGIDYPFTQTMLLKSKIEKNNLGQDIPFMLNQIPGAVINSDAGNGIGYTGIRIRGTDPTRINVTLNGIAYNDAEAQGVFLVNLPDFLSSTNSIQVQRGVGTSSNGSGAFGATVNLLTNEIESKAYGTLSNSIGSYNTRRNTIKAGTGLINNRYTVDIRLSSLLSDGYVDRASSNLKAFYISTASIKENSSLRLNIFSGKEKTYQAWNGITEEQLTNNRKFNSAGSEKPGDPYENETDNYQQTHYQLFYNKNINSSWKFNAALFATKGDGYYEQYKAEEEYQQYGLSEPVINGEEISSSDFIRQLWLDNIYYGTNFSFQLKEAKKEIILGGGNSIYEGQHVGKIIWASHGAPKDFRWYDLDARKSEQYVFGKWLQQAGSISIFGDLQMRTVHYAIGGFRNTPNVSINKNWMFINPKAGVRFTKNGYNAYLSYALANKEPNRDDFEAGSAEMPRHETLHDIEAGIEKKLRGAKLSATFYHMNYKNQLVLTGKINDVGAYTRTNIPTSSRTGIELEAEIKLAKWLTLNNNIALSSNKIRKFTEYVDDYDEGKQQATNYDRTNLAFSPAVVYNAILSAKPVKQLEVNLTTKYVSRQYLDNSSRKDRSLDAYLIQDLQFNYTFLPKGMKSIDLMVQINNIWSKLYAPNGYTYSYIYDSELVKNNYYFPMAERNFMVGLNINL